MHYDGPTVPNVGWHESGATPESGTSGETLTWPGARERPQQTPGPDRSSTRSVNATLFGVSLGANVVLLISLLGVLLLSHAGVFAPRGPAGSSTPRNVLSSPTATPSPIPLAGWLRVTPSSVQLGCDASQRTHFVLLENTGPLRVHWQALLTGSAGSASPAGVAVNPNQGELDAGASLPLQLQNTTHSSGAQGVSGQQGTIRFAPTPADAGPPSGLTYTTVGC